MNLVPRPDLEIRNGELLAAETIARTTGALTVELIDGYIAKLKELRNFVAAGNLVPICPELTNANPSAPHTVILEAMAWQLEQMGYRINQIPDQNHVEFARLFKIELREAVKAETVIRFAAFPLNPGETATITVPAGTQIADKNSVYVFETTEEIQVEQTSAGGTGDAKARRMVAGHTLLPPNVLTNQIDTIAAIATTTNPFAIDSGSSAESLESALERARQYQQRAERIVSDRDLENAILSEVLDNSGVVRVFPFVRNGQFSADPQLGYSTVVIATSNGFSVDDTTKQSIARLFEQLPGNQYYSIADVSFAVFNVAAQVALEPDAQLSVVAAQIEQNLRAFYSVSRSKFGRPILRSEIIAVIESSRGVNFVRAQSNDQILIEPVGDSFIYPWQIPAVAEVTITEWEI